MNEDAHDDKKNTCSNHYLSKAGVKDNLYFRMMYAITMVALRLTP